MIFPKETVFGDKVEVREMVRICRDALHPIMTDSQEVNFVFGHLDHYLETGQVTVEKECWYCGGRSEGEHAIHDTHFMDGPEVPLCNGCGSGASPSCEEIWQRIAERRGVPRSQL